MIIVNFKTYQEVSGVRAVNLARIIAEVTSETGKEIIACPQMTDLIAVHQILPTATWAQHADFQETGKSTGWVTPEALKESGANGILLNHSEHRLPVEVLKGTINRCRMLGLTTLVFAANIDEALEYMVYKPTIIGYEPPELIASETTSVARAKPDIISSVVAAVAPVPVVVGAGVKDHSDVKVSIQLGAKGVALASAITLSADPKKVLMDLASGL
jgi:triosephosphate isomerase (TIM)